MDPPLSLTIEKLILTCETLFFGQLYNDKKQMNRARELNDQIWFLQLSEKRDSGNEERSVVGPLLLSN